MDERPPFKPGPQGGLLGCLAAAAFLAVASVPLLFVLAWGGAHCTPVPECQRAGERMMLVPAAIVLGCALLLFLAVKALVDWSLRRSHDPALAGRRPIWAIAVVLLLSLLVLKTCADLR
jgi:hypothetical protein